MFGVKTVAFIKKDLIKNPVAKMQRDNFYFMIIYGISS